MLQGEPDQKERGYIWHTAIGLQQTDGLKTSEYLIATANRNINGEITLEEAQSLINSYYESKPIESDDNTRTEEADKVSATVSLILAEKAFSFSPVEYISIHRRLFDGVYKFAGKIRDYNISKKEWVLNGETVYYAGADSIRETLEYDFKREREFDYKTLSVTEAAKQIAKFISGLWQIHAFGEGNTRTTAVFAIKYLRTFGFDVTNDIFAENAWYFRNALVRANYRNIKKGIHATQEFLDRFFANLLLNENNTLKNRDLRVKKLNDDTVNDTVNDTVKLSESQRRVLAALKKNPNITAERIAKQCNISESTVKRALSVLKNKEFINRVGSDKTGYWVCL
ncbi:MAG: Fic family protein [Oscillospiraceae bacterium]|nr:Fic family protein [Oscillospiraceae bacterium]